MSAKGNPPVKGGKGFVVEDYIRRLRLLRVAYAGDNQIEFAKRLGVPFKRWSNYERGYPIPRETAWLLLEMIEGLTVEWLWFGWEDYLGEGLKRKLEQAAQMDQGILDAERELENAQIRLKQARERASKKPTFVPPPRRKVSRVSD